ncbi:MAG: hypothetical protein N4A49_01900 [Marinifilaceae bacterium]|jgi:hypothetical protein|nr:hypothetical protein [Marinifilaceae bacterium]
MTSSKNKKDQNKAELLKWQPEKEEINKKNSKDFLSVVVQAKYIIPALLFLGFVSCLWEGTSSLCIALMIIILFVFLEKDNLKDTVE